MKNDWLWTMTSPLLLSTLMKIVCGNDEGLSKKFRTTSGKTAGTTIGGTITSRR